MARACDFCGICPGHFAVDVLMYMIASDVPISSFHYNSCDPHDISNDVPAFFRYNRAIEESNGQDVDVLCGYACYLQTVKAEYERSVPNSNASRNVDSLFRLRRIV